MSKIVKKKLKISGMHCTSCAMIIDFDMEDLDGVTSAKTNYAKQESDLEFDEEKVNLEKIIETIKNSGYEAQVEN